MDVTYVHRRSRHRRGGHGPRPTMARWALPFLIVERWDGGHLRRIRGTSRARCGQKICGWRDRNGRRLGCPCGGSLRRLFDADLGHRAWYLQVRIYLRRSRYWPIMPYSYCQYCQPMRHDKLTDRIILHFMRERTVIFLVTLTSCECAAYFAYGTTLSVCL